MIQISGGQEAKNVGVKKSGHNIPVAPEIRVCHAILFCVAHFPAWRVVCVYLAQ